MAKLKWLHLIKKGIFLALAVFCLAINNYSQNAEIQRLEGLLAQKEINEKAVICNKLSRLYMQQSVTRAYEYVKLAMDYAVASNNFEQIAMANKNKGALFFYQGINDSALWYYQKACNLNKSRGNKKELANSLNNIGVVYENTGRLKEAKEKYNEALHIFEQIKDKDGKSLILTNLGALYMKEAQMSMAISLFEEAILIKKELGKTEGLFTLYNNLGIIYGQKADYENGLKYYKKAYNLSVKEGNLQMQATSLHNMGNVYFEWKDYKNAFSYLNSSISLFERIQYKKGLASTYSSAGGNYAILNDIQNSFENYNKALEIYIMIDDQLGVANTNLSMGTLYYKLLMPEPAERLYNEALVAYKKTNNKKGIIEALYFLGTIESEKDNFTEALKYFEESLEMAEEINYTKMAQKNALAISKTFEKTGNYKLALEYHKMQFLLREKIFTQKSDQYLSEIKTMYKVDKLQKEKQENEKDIGRLEKTRRIVIGILITIILATVIYYLVLQKKMELLRNEKLKAEIDFLRSQINPHFLFNTLNNINTLTLIDPSKASKSILMLSEMMRYQLYECSKKEIALSDEISYLSNLFDLEHLRKPKARFEFSPPRLSAPLLLPPFMFLPYVENAIKHGLFNSPDSFIYIEMSLDDEKLYFQIKNSKQVWQKEKIGGFGLNNAKKRLELLYPKKYELEIKDEPEYYQVNLCLNIN